MSLILIFIHFFLILPAPLPPHPIHVAMTTVEYQPKDEHFTVTFKIFYDDFESIIAEKYGVALNLGKPNQSSDVAEWFQRYLDEHFLLTINDSMPLSLKYESEKINESAIWLYCTIPFTGEIKSVTIQNTVMMDLFYDQTNLVIVKIRDFEKGLRFHRKYYHETLSVDEKS
jgi:hypothetical protein